MVFDVWSIIIIVLVVLGLIIGTVQGFAKQIKFVFGFFGALVAAILLFKLVFLMLQGFGLVDSIGGAIEAKLVAKDANFSTVISAENYTETMAALLQSIKIPEFIVNLFAKKIPYDESFAGLTFGNVAGMGLAKLIVNSIAFIAVLIVAWIVLAILYRLVKKFFTLSLLKPVDVLLGTVIGTVKILIIICGVMWGLSLLTGVSFLSEFVTKIIPTEPESGFSVGYWFYANNPLVWLIGKLF